MQEKVNKFIFSRVMRLSPQVRRELLELIGDCPPCDSELDRIVSLYEKGEKPPRSKAG
jgi:hypothetical protein